MKSVQFETVRVGFLVIQDMNLTFCDETAEWVFEIIFE